MKAAYWGPIITFALAWIPALALSARAMLGYHVTDDQATGAFVWWITFFASTGTLVALGFKVGWHE